MQNQGITLNHQGFKHNFTCLFNYFGSPMYRPVIEEGEGLQSVGVSQIPRLVAGSTCNDLTNYEILRHDYRITITSHANFMS